jgi:hypothetical protein
LITKQSVNRIPPTLVVGAIALRNPVVGRSYEAKDQRNGKVQAETIQPLADFGASPANGCG